MTNPGDAARNVIARALDNLPDGDFFHPDLAEAILAALSAAGYEVVKRDQPLPPTPGPFNPFGKQDSTD